MNNKMIILVFVLLSLISIKSFSKETCLSWENNKAECTKLKKECEEKFPHWYQFLLRWNCSRIACPFSAESCPVRKAAEKGNGYVRDINSGL